MYIFCLFPVSLSEYKFHEVRDLFLPFTAVFPVPVIVSDTQQLLVQLISDLVKPRKTPVK